MSGEPTIVLWLGKSLHEHSGDMSAYGYKQTFQEVSQNVRFTPVSGH